MKHAGTNTNSPGMTYGVLPGVPHAASRLVLGTADLQTWEAAAGMFDGFVERGGRVVDTAYVYGDGECERLLGQWMAARGTRETVVVVGKGAHSPDCLPSKVGRQLEQSLERLQTDHLDVYLVHRDNLDVPVGEFVDAMETERRAGRVRSYGLSNWSIERMKAAKDYAKRHGLPPIVVVSNNFSLAHMELSPWPGCVSSSTLDWRQWFTESGSILLPWSSQAQGFFADGRVETAGGDVAFQQAWLTQANLERRARARRLALERSTSPVAVALAYVLCQPFLTFPLIGPRNSRQLEESMQALSLELTAEELSWLVEGTDGA